MHLLSLINQILDVAKVEAGRMELETETVAVDALVRDTVAMLESTAQAKGIALHSRRAGGGRARSSPTRASCKQILINLIGNAIKFTNEGEVSVAVEVDAASNHPLSISVRDTGIGIPPERQQKVFEPFEQGDSSTRREFGGTGLGLAIVKAFAELIGAAIEVESELGRGTTFTVWLPSGARRRMGEGATVGRRIGRRLVGRRTLQASGSEHRRTDRPSTSARAGSRLARVSLKRHWVPTAAGAAAPSLPRFCAPLCHPTADLHSRCRRCVVSRSPPSFPSRSPSRAAARIRRRAPTTRRPSDRAIRAPGCAATPSCDAMRSSRTIAPTSAAAEDCSSWRISRARARRSSTPSNLATVATVPVGTGPHEVAMSLDGRWAVVTNYGDQTAPGNTLSVIDLYDESPHVVRTIDLGQYARPHGAVFVQSGTKLLVTSETSQRLLLVDFISGRVDTAMATNGKGSHMVTAQRDGRRAWTSNIGDGTVTEFDIDTRTTKRTYKVAPDDESIAATPGGIQLWVGSNTGKTVTVVNAADATILGTLSGFGRPYRVGVSRTGRSVAVVSDPDSNRVFLYDVGTRRELARIDLATQTGIGDAGDESPSRGDRLRSDRRLRLRHPPRHQPGGRDRPEDAEGRRLRHRGRRAGRNRVLALPAALAGGAHAAPTDSSHSTAGFQLS